MLLRILLVSLAVAQAKDVPNGHEIEAPGLASSQTSWVDLTRKRRTIPCSPTFVTKKCAFHRSGRTRTTFAASPTPARSWEQPSAVPWAFSSSWAPSSTAPSSSHAAHAARATRRRARPSKGQRAKALSACQQRVALNPTREIPVRGVVALPGKGPRSSLVIARLGPE